MEAMFDRMDAIGKGILGLTIQCAQCHNHKYDPLTQEEYYRMFAFLNNAHEANVAVYTPAAADEAGRDLPRAPQEIEAELAAPQSRLAEADGRVGRAGAQRTSPNGACCSLTVDDISTGGRDASCRMKDGSMLAQGYAPTKHTVEFTAQDGPAAHHGGPPGVAERPEPAARRPGPVDQGDGRADRVPGGGRAGRRLRTSSRKVKIVEGDGRRQSARDAAGADLRRQERQAPRHRADRVRHRRQGRNGLGHRRRPGPAQPAAQGRVQSRTARSPIPSGTVLTFHLKQNHGGWNSDDNQNNNLGRFRLSVTAAPDAVADPLPQSVREILSIPREQRARAGAARSSATGARPLPEWKAANDAIEALWREHPEGSLATGAGRARRDRARRTC